MKTNSLENQLPRLIAVSAIILLACLAFRHWF